MYEDDENPPDNYYKEHYLSLGLQYLHRLVSANTYDDRYQLMNPELKTEENSLYEAFSEQGDYDDVLIAKLTKEERNAFLRPPFAEDPDV